MDSRSSDFWNEDVVRDLDGVLTSIVDALKESEFDQNAEEVAKQNPRAKVPLRPVTVHARSHRMNCAGPPPRTTGEAKEYGGGTEFVRDTERLFWYSFSF